MRSLMPRSGLALLAAIFVCVCASGSANASDVLDKARARGHLIAAAVPDALPQSGRDGAGTLTGFDIDVSKAIARQLGLDVTFVTPPWQDILAGGWNGWDFAAVSMTPTPERERRLNFPAVYRLSPAVLAVRKDNTAIVKPEDASGKTIGVKEDTTFQQYLNHDLVIYKGQQSFEFAIDKPVIRLFADKQDAMKALVEGNGAALDAVVTSFAHARSAIAAGLPVKMVSGFLYFEPLAVAVDNAEPTFGEEIAGAVEALRADGTLSALSMQWFGIDLTE